jgi:integrase
MPRSEHNGASLVPLTVEQVQAIADTVPALCRALALTSAGLGLRQGEACGLTVDQVDLLRRQVKIDRQLISPSGPGPVTFRPTKTPSSDRVIPLPDSVGEAFAVHLERFGTGPDGLVFTALTSAALRRSTWGKAYKSAATPVGVDSSTHDLRHHCASVLISSGVSIKSVQRFLGHKNANETLDTYGHLMPGDADRLRSAIDVALRGNVRGVCTDGVEQGAI